MSQIKYIICRPAGNDTALVFGTNYTQPQRQNINNQVMKRHTNVEQVGFVSVTGKPELQMAGGEFCGNATRSAAYYYLNGRPGELEILVNSQDQLSTGVNQNGQAWCEIPLGPADKLIAQQSDGIFIVNLSGITIVVLLEAQAKPYLREPQNLKQASRAIIQKYNLTDRSAVGVMFCETANIPDKTLKITPVVWVKQINTLFLETACGSGTTAVGIVETYLKDKSQTIDILQPSGLPITVSTTFENRRIQKAVISGDVYCDNVIYSLNI